MAIIAFEGIDNAGKTTQSLKLQERLKSEGYRAVAAVGGSSPIYELIKAKFQQGEFEIHHKTLLFAAELTERWYKYSPGNEIIIFDRYVYSLIVYGLMENCNRYWIENILTPFPRADIVIYLDISPETYLSRIKDKKRQTSPYTLDKLAQVRGNYLRLAEEKSFFTIDGTKTESEVSELIFQHVSVLLRKLR